MTGDTHSETGDPARLPAPGCWVMGTHKLKKQTVRKKIFCTGLTIAVKAGLKSLLPAWRAQRTNQGWFLFVLFESPFTSDSTVTVSRPLWSLWARPYQTFTKIPLSLFAWIFKKLYSIYFLFRFARMLFVTSDFIWFISTIFHLFTNTICGKYFWFLPSAFAVLTNTYTFDVISALSFLQREQKENYQKKTI
jgi:hypothetical protein